VQEMLGLLQKDHYLEVRSISQFFFIDDNPNLLKKKIDGIRVYSSDKKTLTKIIKKHQIDNVVFSTEKISQVRKKKFFNFF
jgi:FlaA1/EpsC-like NDP-sugar epimerase